MEPPGGASKWPDSGRYITGAVPTELWPPLKKKTASKHPPNPDVQMQSSCEASVRCFRDICSRFFPWTGGGYLCLVTPHRSSLCDNQHSRVAQVPLRGEIRRYFPRIFLSPMSCVSSSLPRALSQPLIAHCFTPSLPLCPLLKP